MNTAPWQRRFARLLLTAIGARQTSRMRFAIIAWQAQETGWKEPANHNYLNIMHRGKPLAYPDMDTAIKAIARTLTEDARFARWSGYDRVVAAARANDPMGFIEALAKSKWDAGRYGAPKTNNVLNVYRDIVDGLPGHWFTRPVVAKTDDEEAEP